MLINTNISNRCAIISLQGRFDFSANPAFKKAYEPLLQMIEISELEIDLGAVQYLDSSALGILLLLKERADKMGKTIALSNCQGTVKRILDIANFIKLFNIR
jgi:anti-anti-sigma factor